MIHKKQNYIASAWVLNIIFVMSAFLPSNSTYKSLEFNTSNCLSISLFLSFNSYDDENYAEFFIAEGERNLAVSLCSYNAAQTGSTNA